MGRRSINTTKSGKYMNPTDQARKELRKKELKKNRKQRQMVRLLILKGKDPHQLIAEMEKIDQMEYNLHQPPPLNEKVLKDKRKKLKETFERVLKLYSKDDHEKWFELKHLETEYERKRDRLIAYFESVRYAQQVRVDEIPLPQTSLMQSDDSDNLGVITKEVEKDIIMHIPLPSDLPLTSSLLVPITSTQVAKVSCQVALSPTYPKMSPESGLTVPIQGTILKKASAYSYTLPPGKIPPGVPVGPPPDLSDEEDEEDDKAAGKDSEITSMETDASCIKQGVCYKVLRFVEQVNDKSKTPGERMEMEYYRKGVIMDEKNRESDSHKPEYRYDEKETLNLRPNMFQQKMFQMAGQDIDEFIRVMEEVHRRELGKPADINTRVPHINQEAEENSRKNEQYNMQRSSLIPNSQPPSIPEQLQVPSIQQVQMVQQFRQMVPVQQIIPYPLPVPPPPLALMTQPPPQLPQLRNQQQGMLQNIRRIPPAPLLTIPLPPPPPPLPPPLMRFRSPTGAIHLPPGPHPGIPPLSTRNIIGLPLDPPPGMPPNVLHPPTSLLPPPLRIPQVAPPHPSILLQLDGGTNQNVLSAAPQLIKQRGIEMGEFSIGKLHEHGATIKAKPQIKNLNAGVTRFLPTSLRLRREDQKKKYGKRLNSLTPVTKPESTVVSPKPVLNTSTNQSKDDAYLQFMKEIEALL
ncbi:hypothetical protein J437_LFUL011498 [Ladona fulva]|uniref:Wbp11/ELF5/Saf1 N-terminal domain-containing protein n=1 Tax=Ladona fulva TaxID=123851 RepID=A0A8K0K8K2_LADFU|nr:hypothetical protein J437_LFUL011498 [Ladona fulva]